jgi:hypothetical protein
MAPLGAPTRWLGLECTTPTVRVQRLLSSEDALRFRLAVPIPPAPWACVPRLVTQGTGVRHLG